MSDVQMTLIRLPLPADLADHYEAQAVLLGLTLEQYLEHHLERSKAWIDKTPIYLDDPHAAKIRELLGGKANDPDRLIAIVGKLAEVRVGGIAVQLPLATQEAIQWACHSLGKPVGEAAPQMIADAVREKFHG